MKETTPSYLLLLKQFGVEGQVEPTRCSQPIQPKSKHNNLSFHHPNNAQVLSKRHQQTFALQVVAPRQWKEAMRQIDFRPEAYRVAIDLLCDTRFLPSTNGTPRYLNRSFMSVQRVVTGKSPIKWLQ